MSRTTRYYVDVMSPTIFNINLRLYDFFEDPNSFRVLQSRTGMLISGSFALQFIARETYPGSDLDLFVPSMSKTYVATWIAASGYEYKPRVAKYNLLDEVVQKGQPPTWQEAFEEMDGGEAPADYFMSGVAGVVTFVRMKDDDTVEKEVQIIVTQSCPMAAILNFHSSAFPLSCPILCDLTMNQPAS